MEESTKLFKSCSLLMAFLFAYSASVQFNDPVRVLHDYSDWYLWFPLYASACVVNLLLHNIFKTCKTIAKVAFWLGVFLFVKVVIEDYVNELAGFWSLDLEERVVREKIGSGLVVISMLLHLEALAIKSSKGYVQYGMTLFIVFFYFYH
ncbi:hypothetical protein AQUCO_00700121v1 [Aquilegia coerulea]|uniref:Uncharacterized protein n=1 Tax=Aquilegia coerulea TaxID=218851 RepID=A0A2G5EIK7_AQUCA|nr:hypothetical protein AQUCO_00700121v1 [Aquilegia coerulea]